MKDDQQFFVAQKAFIEKDGQVLILHDPIEGLDFPGGKIQENELSKNDFSTLAKSLKREVAEETNLNIEVGKPFAVWYSEYPLNHRNYPKKVYLIGFRCKYISGELKLSDEHDEFKWVNESNYQDYDDGSNWFGILKEYFSSSI